MSPELPQNLKLGQIRRTAGIVTQGEWNSLTRDEQEAVDALSGQIVWRCRQKRHPSREGEACIFLTVRHVQRLLRAIGVSTALLMLTPAGPSRIRGRSRAPLPDARLQPLACAGPLGV